MHAAFFSLKRAYWGSLRVSRKRLAEKGLTAARFDLLYAVAMGTRDQRLLHRKLGVTRPVVSRMLKGLREKGIVRREKSIVDGRAWRIGLTKWGRKVVRDAIEEFVHCGVARRWVQRALCPVVPEGESRWAVALERLAHFLSLLQLLYERFESGASLDYPWAPDD